jgi:hypothetical protein
METIPARRGKATYVKRGQSIRIVNTHGAQVVDTCRGSATVSIPTAAARSSP